MKVFLRTIGVLIAAITICAALLAILMTATNTLTVIDTEAADFLPQNHTIALFTNVSEETLRRFETLFPILGEIPSQPSSTVALLRFEDEMLMAQFQEDFAQENPTFGRFTVTASKDRVLDLLKGSTPRLRSSSAYHALAASRSADKAWVFLDLTTLPEPESISQNLAWSLFPEGSTHAALTFENGMTQLSFAGKALAPDRGLSPTITSSFSGSFLTTRFANISHVLNKILNETDDDVRSLFNGKVRKVIEENFGEEVSFQYDFMPMLEGPTSLHIGNNASGKLLFALEGVARSSKDIEARLNKLHEGFKETIPQTRIVKRTLDNRFSSLDIRMDPSLIDEEKSKYENWNMFATISGDGTTFVTARRGATFVIANDKDALEQILNQNVSHTPPTSSTITSAIRLADGIAQKDGFSVFLKENLKVLLEGNLLPFPVALSGTVLWSVEQRGMVRTLTIESM